MKIGAEAALVGISYDFGQSTVTKAHIASLESFACYFPKGYGQSPDAESVLDPRENEVVVFKDFFTAGLRMPPHSVLLDILCKFQV
jgi:predicted hydrocarbon binding protein